VISQIREATTAKRMTIGRPVLSAMHRLRLYVAGHSSARVYNHSIVGENGDFQPLHPKMSRNSQISNAATVTINHQLEICCRFISSLGAFIHALLSRAYLCVS